VRRCWAIRPGLPTPWSGREVGHGCPNSSKHGKRPSTRRLASWSANSSGCWTPSPSSGWSCAPSPVGSTRSARPSAPIGTATFAQRRLLVELLIDRVIVTDGESRSARCCPPHPAAHTTLLPAAEKTISTPPAQLGQTHQLLKGVVSGRLASRCVVGSGSPAGHSATRQRTGSRPPRWRGAACPRPGRTRGVTNREASCSPSAPSRQATIVATCALAASYLPDPTGDVSSSRQHPRPGRIRRWHLGHHLVRRQGPAGSLRASPHPPSHVRARPGRRANRLIGFQRGVMVAIGPSWACRCRAAPGSGSG
jgi:hypothetical protein